MKTLVDHLAQYAAYHRDRRNIVTHFVGIPMIVLAVTAFCLIHLQALKLHIDDHDLDRKLAALSLWLRAVIIFAAVGWSMITMGMLMSPSQSIRVLGLLVAVAHIAVGALGSFALPTTNLIWLCGFIPGYWKRPSIPSTTLQTIC